MYFYGNTVIEVFTQVSKFLNQQQHYVHCGLSNRVDSMNRWHYQNQNDAPSAAMSEVSKFKGPRRVHRTDSMASGMASIALVWCVTRGEVSSSA